MNTLDWRPQPEPPDPAEEKWQDRGLCAQTDPDTFFPNPGGSTREAKQTCQLCDVKEDCLQYALDHNEQHGIWGGLSPRERHAIKPIQQEPYDNEIGRLTAAGVCARVIAEQLHTTPRSVTRARARNRRRDQAAAA